ncbi:MAG TPA: hypothetical protein VGP93_01420 [Polyangiaceae bacterium]|nr:hypothetical protein [Polyangiaceae bacterium]
MRPVTLRSAWFALLGAAALAPGCKCGSDKPYTPFGIASSLPAASASGSGLELSSASVAPQSSGFVPRKAELAPGGVRRWNLAGTSIDAPEGRRFEQALSADFDGDGENEIVAWLLAQEGQSPSKVVPAGELWLFPKSAPSRAILQLPMFVPTGPNCRLAAKLAQTGPHSVTLDVQSACDARLIPRSPVGALVVLAPLSDDPPIQLLRRAADPPGEKLELVVVSDDRDGDGRDDPLVHATLTAAGKPIAADLAWFDRAAGASRDSGEPMRSLARAAAREAARAKQKKTAADVLERVATLRRLAAALCAESATSRLFDRDGAALHCDALDGFVDSLAFAELEANLAQGDVLEAFAAHSRDGWYLRAMSSKQKSTLERDLLAAVTRRQATALTLAAAPQVAAGPHYSPLAFDADGTLLVQTAQSPQRFALDGSAAPRDGDETLTRSLKVVAPGSEQRFSDIIYACDRSELSLEIEAGSALTTRLLAPRPGACAGARFTPFPAPAVIAFAGGEMEALIAGSLVKAGSGRGLLPELGSPRSLDGHWLVVPTRLGLLLRGDKPELWELPASAPKPSELADCVVGNERRAVACVAGKRALLFSASP